MSIKIYDEALLQKLRKWTEKTEIQIYGPGEIDRLFQTIADKSNDSNIKLPLLSLNRTAGFTITNINKKPLSFDGLTVDETLTNATSLNAIPVKINYQLDVYTRYLEESDLFARNLAFNIINYPKLVINIPYNNYNIEHVATLRLSETIEGKSSNQKRFAPGQFTVVSLGLNIDDAYLWDTRVRNNISINAGGLEIHIKDDDSFIIETID